MNKTYLTCAETARLLRKALKRAFPETKFYVRSKTYAGGASINVNWVDGPTRKEVDAVAQQFSGKDFDGMIDMGCYYDHWLLPDGSTIPASSPGTTGSMGTIAPTKNPQPLGSELVSFGANYVFASRTCSPELVEKFGRELSEKMGWEMPEIETSAAYLTRTKTVPSAHFKTDWGKFVPGSTDLLGDWFNRELWNAK